MYFPRYKRDRVIDYVKNKYGHDHVSHMVTFGRLQGRSALKEVLRVKGVCGFEEMNRITKYIPDEAKISDQLEIMREEDKQAGGDGDASIIMWALENNPKQLKEWAFLDDKGVIQGPLSKIFEQAIRIEGTRKSQGKHASGIAISDFPIAEVCPMAYDGSSGETIAALPMEDLEAIGVVKFDFLSVNLLSKIKGALDLVS